MPRDSRSDKQRILLVHEILLKRSDEVNPIGNAGIAEAVKKVAYESGVARI